jgi:alpha-L-arabinofuranosidase
VRYWEIGNEVYGSWEEGHTVSGKEDLTGEIYGKDLRVIADAMKKVDPAIYIGAVAVETDNGEDQKGFHWWMRDLLPQLQGKADYLILHQYFMWPFTGKTYNNPSNEKLFSNVTQIAEGYTSTEQMVDQYAAAEKGIPIVLTEFNLVNANPPPSIELINGLFTAEVLGEHIKAGYVASNYWDWRNGLDKKMGGDMAMLATGDPSIPDATPRPTYYTYALFARAFGDKMVAAESSEPTVKVYASRFAGGQLGLVIVNENEKNQTLTFDLSGFTSTGKLAGWVLTGKDLNAKQVSWNGVLGPAAGGGPFPLDTIPAYRAGFKPNTPLQLPIQANSVTGIIIY